MASTQNKPLSSGDNRTMVLPPAPATSPAPRFRTVSPRGLSVVLLVRAALGVLAGTYALLTAGEANGPVSVAVRTVGGLQLLLALLLVGCGIKLRRDNRDLSLAITAIELVNIALLAELPLSHTVEVLLSMIILGALYLPFGARLSDDGPGDGLLNFLWGIAVVPTTAGAFVYGLTVFGRYPLDDPNGFSNANVQLTVGFLCMAVAFAGVSRLVVRLQR